MFNLQVSVSLEQPMMSILWTLRQVNGQRSSRKAICLLLEQPMQLLL